MGELVQEFFGLLSRYRHRSLKQLDCFIGQKFVSARGFHRDGKHPQRP